MHYFLHKDIHTIENGTVFTIVRKNGLRKFLKKAIDSKMEQ